MAKLATVAYTRAQDNSGNQHGQDLAAMLLGVVTGGRIEQFGDRFNQVWYHGVFVQDDWRVSNRLTLNLGLRYEYETAPTERFNRNVRGFDPDAELAITAAARAAYAASPIPELPVAAFRPVGGVRFVDDANRQFWNPDANNVQPRVGFAYRWNDKTLMRGGWGLYTQPTYVFGTRQLGFSANTNIVASLDTGLTFRSTLVNPFPDGVLVEPVGQTLGPNTNVGGTLSRFFDDIDFRNGHAMRTVIGVQRELPGRVMVEANYVGTKGYDLRTDVQVNALPNHLLSTSPIRDQARIDYLNSTSSTGGVPNPLRGLVPGTNLNGTNTSRQRLLRPYPQFESIEGRRYDGSSLYHSLQLRVDRRFHNGLTVLTTYTYARGTDRVSRLNEGDTEYYERPTGIPHRFVFNPIYELPFGRGRTFAGDAGRSLDSLIGGWSIAGVYQYQSGQMLGIGNLYYAGDITQLRTTITQGIDVNNPVFDFSGFYFNDAAVRDGSGAVSPALQRSDARIDLERNLRTLPSRVRGFTGTPMSYLDMSFVKRLPLAGRVRAQIHIEVYNATNFAWFTNPNLSPDSASFGIVSGTRNLPREVQIGAKILF